jgi:hypothetical protein
VQIRKKPRPGASVLRIGIITNFWFYFQIPRTQKNNVPRLPKGVTLMEGLQESEAGGQEQEPQVQKQDNQNQNQSVIGYLLSSTVSSSQLGNLLQPELGLGLMSGSGGQREACSHPPPSNRTTITVCVPQQQQQQANSSPLHNHSHHPPTILSHMISKGINVSGTQILTKTD